MCYGPGICTVLLRARNMYCLVTGPEYVLSAGASVHLSTLGILQAAAVKGLRDGDGCCEIHLQQIKFSTTSRSKTHSFRSVYSHK